MPETISLEPNYNAIHSLFLREAEMSATKLTRAAQATDPYTAYNTMRVIHNVLISLNLAVGCATTVEQIEAIRTAMEKITKATSLELQLREKRLPDGGNDDDE
jgi:hypothetical protein